MTIARFSFDYCNFLWISPKLPLNSSYFPGGFLSFPPETQGSFLGVQSESAAAKMTWPWIMATLILCVVLLIVHFWASLLKVYPWWTMQRLRIYPWPGKYLGGVTPLLYLNYLASASADFPYFLSRLYVHAYLFGDTWDRLLHKIFCTIKKESHIHNPLYFRALFADSLTTSTFCANNAYSSCIQGAT